MKHRPLPLFAGCLLAATVAIACLLLAFADGRIISPFGWNRVVVVHVISSLPLAFVAAGLLCRTRLSMNAKPVAVMLALIWLGLIVLITIFGGVFVAHILDVSDAGFTVRMIARTVWTLTLEVPCFWLVLLLIRPIQMPRRVFVHLAIWSVAVIALVPFGFIITLTHKQTDLAKASWQAFRVDKAIEKTDRLCAVGSMASFGVQNEPTADEEVAENSVTEENQTQEVTARQAQAALMKNATMLVKAIKLTENQELTDANRLAMAKCLRSIGELDRAAILLEPIADKIPEAAMLLGRVLQAKNDWATSSKWFQTAVEQMLKLKEEPRSNKTARLLCQAYGYLSQNAHQMQKYDDAEQYYLDAIENVPSHAAYFHYKLAQHYDLSGRLSNSLVHYQQAHQLAPDRYPAPPSWAQKFLSSSTPVGILAPSQSNY